VPSWRLRDEPHAPERSCLDLSIFRVGPGRAGLKKILLFQVEKILPMTIPLDASGLNFRDGLGPGPGLGGLPVYFIV
jgi:hypothetical protein